MLFVNCENCFTVVVSPNFAINFFIVVDVDLSVFNPFKNVRFPFLGVTLTAAFASNCKVFLISVL